MKTVHIVGIFVATLAEFFCIAAHGQSAKWIAPADGIVDAPNRWLAFRKDFNVDEIPMSAKARIAADSKYWLWINGRLAVFEGSLKRGPTPTGTYFDEIDIAPFLKKGENRLAMLVWYFGKDGFSHKSSGRAGMVFSLDSSPKLFSDSSWLSRIHPAYEMAGFPLPNYRLPESHVRFNAQNDMPDWQTAPDSAAKLGFKKSEERGQWGDAPWGELVRRPIPMWRDYGVKEAKTKTVYGRGGAVKTDAVTAFLPYNMQMTPVITVDDPVGNSLIEIRTDHTYSANEKNLRAEYITKKGRQTYESLGWLNGEKIELIVPRGVKVEKVQYRETGFDCDLLGKFSCDDEYFNIFWRKAMRTLYVNMRDTYFDCPERERAQWIGDAVILMGQSFYNYSKSANSIMRKCIREVCLWQKPDGTIYGPIPGTCKGELPGQMLAFVGNFGLWNYYMNTGDTDTIRFAYPRVKKYLEAWGFDSDGLPERRAQSLWLWGDWGENVDKRMVYAALYYIALDSTAKIADALGKGDDSAALRNTMESVKTAFDKFWDGKAYRHKDYKLKTDDRVQALAVLAGIADESKYPAIIEFLQNNRHASPYMERYVMEAYFKLGRGADGVKRVRERYATMVNNKNCTTLYEGWEIGTYGGGSVNHAWSGGPITVISQYVLGAYPLEPAWKVFKIEPDPAGFGRASMEIPAPIGKIKTAFVSGEDTFELSLTVPDNSTAVVKLPVKKDASISINASSDVAKFASKEYADAEKPVFELPAGEYKIRAILK